MALLARTLWMLLCGMMLVSQAMAQDLTLIEQKIKAGMLYNFLKYTDWPQAAEMPGSISICLLGGDPFDGNLSPLEGRSVNQRTIHLRMLNADGDVGGCQLLVVDASAAPRWPALRAVLDDKPIFTVSDSEGFAKAGGMVEFAHNGSHIMVKMNLAAVHAAHMEVQQRLRNLVTIVGGQE